HDQLAIVFRQLELFRNALGQLGALFGVVDGEPFARIVQKQREVQQVLAPDLTIGQADRAAVFEPAAGGLHRPDRVLVDRVLVIVVELNEAADMLERRNEPSEQADGVKVPQKTSEAHRLGEGLQKQLAALGRYFAWSRMGASTLESC